MHMSVDKIDSDCLHEVRQGCRAYSFPITCMWGKIVRGDRDAGSRRWDGRGQRRGRDGLVSDAAKRFPDLRVPISW